jgi:hypothetical protein
VQFDRCRCEAALIYSVYHELPGQDQYRGKLAGLTLLSLPGPCSRLAECPNRRDGSRLANELFRLLACLVNIFRCELTKTERKLKTVELSVIRSPLEYDFSADSTEYLPSNHYGSMGDS